MNCNEARDLFSPWMDGDINKEEKRLLQAHLDSCVVCRQELREWEEISGVLKQLHHETMAAPAGFSNLVMDKIKQENKLRRFTGAKHIAAGIAAALALFLGSSSLLMNPVVQVAQKTPPAIEEKVDPTAQTNKVAETGQPDTVNPSPISKPQVNVPEAGNKTVSPFTGGLKIAANNATTISEPQELFLNKERAIYSTILKVLVGDNILMEQNVKMLASASGASVQSLGNHVDANGSAVMLSISCPSAKADGLIKSLSALGSELSREETKQDLTVRFNETREQYRVLVSRAAAAQSPEEQAELEKQVKSLEDQLRSWEKDSAQETIVLWLETKK